jgi:hypothetical protein
MAAQRARNSCSKKTRPATSGEEISAWPTGKRSHQSQQLQVRELQTQLRTLEQARDRNDNVTIDATVRH